jgi:hypothetical protein
MMILLKITYMIQLMVKTTSLADRKPNVFETCPVNGEVMNDDTGRLPYAGMSAVQVQAV